MYQHETTRRHAMTTKENMNPSRTAARVVGAVPRRARGGPWGERAHPIHSEHAGSPFHGVRPEPVGIWQRFVQKWAVWWLHTFKAAFKSRFYRYVWLKSCLSIL